jgi:hypothetical protein
MWAKDSQGRRQAREFFENLDEGDRGKLLALFKRLASQGPQAMHNREKFKKVGQEGSHKLFEFKSFQLRFIGEYRGGKVFAVAHGLRKKGDDLPKSAREVAARILDAYQGEEN